MWGRQKEIAQTKGTYTQVGLPSARGGKASSRGRKKASGAPAEYGGGIVYEAKVEANATGYENHFARHAELLLRCVTPEGDRVELHMVPAVVASPSASIGAGAGAGAGAAHARYAQPDMSLSPAKVGQQAHLLFKIVREARHDPHGDGADVSTDELLLAGCSCGGDADGWVGASSLALAAFRRRGEGAAASSHAAFENQLQVIAGQLPAIRCLHVASAKVVGTSSSCLEPVFISLHAGRATVAVDHARAAEVSDAMHARGDGETTAPERTYAIYSPRASSSLRRKVHYIVGPLRSGAAGPELDDAIAFQRGGLVSIGPRGGLNCTRCGATSNCGHCHAVRRAHETGAPGFGGARPPRTLDGNARGAGADSDADGDGDGPSAARPPASRSTYPRTSAALLDDGACAGAGAGAGAGALPPHQRKGSVTARTFIEV
jgi:hypothetical protein